MKSTVLIKTGDVGGRGWSRFGEAPVGRALTGASLPLVGPAPATPSNSGTRSKNSTRRRGASLIEMVTAIALLGSLITVTATTLHQVLRTETVARRGNDRLTAVSRAATAFRADVHAATEITLADEGRHLTCRFADQSVVDYVVEPTALRRTYQPPGNAAPQREAYVLHDATVSFRSEERSGRTVYTMLWQLPPAGVVSAATTVPVTPVPIPIEAVPRRSPAGS